MKEDYPIKEQRVQHEISRSPVHNHSYLIFTRWLESRMCPIRCHVLATHTSKKGCTMGQHVLTLFQTKLFHHIQRGAKEIHFVFDTPMGFNNHPKSIEHKYRYNSDSDCPSEDHIKPSDSMKCPKDWNLPMECRQYKHNLASYIGQKLLQISPEYLKSNQKVYVAGYEIEGSCERTMYTTCTAMLDPEPRLRCNTAMGKTHS